MVTAVGTDAWVGTRTRAARLLGRGGQREEAVLRRLDQTAAELEHASAEDARTGLEQVRGTQTQSWQTRFTDLLQDLPEPERAEVIAELRSLVEHAQRCSPGSGALAATDGSMAAGVVARTYAHEPFAAGGGVPELTAPDSSKAEVDMLRKEIAGRLRAGDTDQVLKGCEQLAALGPSYREEAASTAERAFGNRYATGSQHFLAAELLESLGSRFHDAAAQHLWEIIESAGAEHGERERAAKSLLVIGRRYYAEAERRAPGLTAGRDNEKCYGELLAALRERREPQAPLWNYGDVVNDVLEGIRNCRRLDDCPEEATGFFNKEARERRKQAQTLQAHLSGAWRYGVPFGSVIALAVLGPQYRKMAETRLTSRLTDAWADDADGDRCAGVGIAFSALGPQYSKKAVQALLAALVDARTKPQLCRLAAHVLVEHGAEYREEAVLAVRRLLADPTVEVEDRIKASVSLAGLEAERTEEAAMALRAIAATKDVWIEERVEAARVLEGFGGRYREEAGRALQAMISDDKDLRLAERAETVEALVQLGFAGQAPDRG
ncbi:hypothetical protein J7E88_13970 [Streptomyces sp. ISL-10]|uniref:hypothetical protein n=1 Tax=Streptomyces sp. ISL-10 TaxID=2819172 RepID=UPI001BEB6254|nr:hypothetical protein [Streptomyces sp. ISL-10]MBT2366381.1 hypothetical protein [Streptomyces sp. ISL-10]